ncbi:MAG TPA: DUF504 domain-containing protein [Usitatibacter sp.]|nr:DUF504 domain-containing protein [Usitatibacter sp.]
MTPLRDLLARIRWDPDFGRARFEIAYLDRQAMGLVRVPLERVDFPAGAAFAFETTDDEGVARSVPLHRVREVRRNGRLIWSRTPPRPGKPATSPRANPAARKVARDVRPPRSRAAR